MKKFHLTKRTHILSEQTTKQMVLHEMIVLLPLFIFGYIKNGMIPFYKGASWGSLISPFIFFLLTLLSCFVAEIIVDYGKTLIRKEKFDFKKWIKTSHFYITGLLLTLMLPMNLPYHWLLLTGFVGTFVSKLLYDKWRFHPVLISYLFCMIVFGQQLFSSTNGFLSALDLESVTNPGNDTPVHLMATIEGVGNYQTLVAPFGRMMNFVIGMVPGGFGTTSAILCILGFVYLTYVKAIKWRIPTFFIGTVLVMSYMIGAYHEIGLWYSLYQVVIGGLLFAAIYVATDSDTTPVTPIGQILYGIALGITTIFLRYICDIEYAVFLSIFLISLLVKLFDYIGSRARFDFNFAMGPFCILWTLILLLGIQIGTTFPKTELPQEVEKEEPKVEQPVQKPEFKIIGEQDLPPYHVWDVIDSTNQGAYQLKIYTLGKTIYSIQLTSHSETGEVYQAFLNSNYLGQLIINQTNIAGLPAIEGMELSTAVKDSVYQFYTLLQANPNL